MEICSITADQSDGSEGCDGDESMWLSSDSSSSPFLLSESSWSLLDSFSAYFVSLVNLDVEDSRLIPDGEFDFDWFQSDFPSPAHGSAFDFKVKIAGAGGVEDVDHDEPIFWPLEQKVDWKSMEDWDWFAISPRKDLKSLATPPRSTGFRLHGRKLNPNQEPKRRLVFTSRSAASEMMELKHGQDKKVTVPRIAAVPSRFNRRTKIPAGKPSNNKSLPVDSDFPENVEVPIETLLGLGEFDGHEGIGSDSEFDDVVLSLDETCTVINQLSFSG